jgi:hypothetical protein
VCQPVDHATHDGCWTNRHLALRTEGRSVAERESANSALFIRNFRTLNVHPNLYPQIYPQSAVGF